MEENQEEYIIRKVKINYNYKVDVRQNKDGKLFYKLNVPQKQADGQINWFKININMPAGTDIPDGCKIKIKQAIENLYFSASDPKHYNPIYGLYIKEFEVVDEIVQEYAEELTNMSEDDLPF